MGQQFGSKVANSNIDDTGIAQCGAARTGVIMEGRFRRWPGSL